MTVPIILDWKNEIVDFITKNSYSRINYLTGLKCLGLIVQ